MRDKGPHEGGCQRLAQRRASALSGLDAPQKFMAPLLAPDFSPFDTQRKANVSASKHVLARVRKQWLIEFFTCTPGHRSEQGNP